MQVPAAEFIESAEDWLPSVPDAIKADQLKELHEAVGDKSADFQDGYQLGIQTARSVLAMKPAGAGML